MVFFVFVDCLYYEGSGVDEMILIGLDTACKPAVIATYYLLSQYVCVCVCSNYKEAGHS